jgi:hypothetical protein
MWMNPPASWDGTLATMEGAAARRTRGRQRRRTALAFAVGLLVLLVAGGLAYRPAVVLGVGGKALANSVRSETGGSSFITASCRERAGESWRCSIPDRGASSTVTYEVDTRGGWGCWDALRVGPRAGEGDTPRTASGCINSFDLIRPLDRIFG